MAISYSMCWEDPLILLKALNISNRDNVLSIVSGGENLLAILLKNPNKLIGIDIKKEQIYLKNEIDYWFNNLNLIEGGIIHCGKFERYLSKFRRYCIPLIISKKKVSKFLSLNSL